MVINQVITPPLCLGVMGGGQLARMFAIAAKQMGYKVAILEPDENCPASSVVDHHIVAMYDDKDGLDKLTKLSSVVTTEFENVSALSLKYLLTKVAVHPSPEAISIAQNRYLEKSFFNTLGIKTTPYTYITKIEDINNLNLSIFPAILKTNTLGYDGKGQIGVTDKITTLKAFEDLSQVPCVLEKKVLLKLEVSIMVARNSSATVCYPVSQNIHKNGILDIGIVPAPISDAMINYIEDVAKRVINHLDYVGVLGIEFFITKDGQVLANEMAPRPHNSGHYTIDACYTSQFEQQVRAICNLQLGNTRMYTNSIMLNLMGEMWQSPIKYPLFTNILTKYDNLKLHLYDKIEAREARKMGHLVITGTELQQLYIQLEEIKNQLTQIKE